MAWVKSKPIEFQLSVTTMHEEMKTTDFNRLCKTTVDEVQSRCKDLDVFLKSRCVGLLELHQYYQQTTGSEVRYLHRTVKDFLLSAEVQAAMLKVAAENFDPPRLWSWQALSY